MAVIPDDFAHAVRARLEISGITPVHADVKDPEDPRLMGGTRTLAACVDEATARLLADSVNLAFKTEAPGGLQEEVNRLREDMKEGKENADLAEAELQEKTRALDTANDRIETLEEALADAGLEDNS